MSLGHLMIGSTFKRINVEEIRGLMIPLPPVDEPVENAAAADGAAREASCLTVEAELAITLPQERRLALDP